MQIAQLMGLQKGSVIQEPVVGTVKHVFGFRQGTGEFGPWTRMDFVIEDGTGDIPVSLWEPQVQDANAFMGAQISFVAYQVERGLVGCSIDEYVKKDKTTQQPIIDPATGLATMVKKIKCRGRAATFLSPVGSVAPAPAQASLPQPAYQQPAAQPAAQTRQYVPTAQSVPDKVTDADITASVQSWADALVAALPQPTSPEGEAARIKAVGAFCSTLCINVGDKKIALAPTSRVAVPAAQAFGGGGQATAPQQAETPPADDEPPF